MKNYVKKCLTVLLVLILAFGLFACNNSNSSQESGNESGNNSSGNTLGETAISRFQTGENCYVFHFNNFSGRSEIKTQRNLTRDSYIYYSVQLESGNLTVSYAGASKPLFTGSGVHDFVESSEKVSGEEITMIFESADTVNGKVIISFVHVNEVCENGHTWNAGVIEEIAGNNYMSKKVFTCTICGHTQIYNIRKSEVGIDERHSLTVSEGSEKLYEMPYDHYYSGELVEIKVSKLTDVDVSVSVIQASNINYGRTYIDFVEYKDFNCFSFLMPTEDITIQIEIANYAFEHESLSWLNQISSENVIKVKQTDEYIGIAPGNTKNHIYTTDTDEIERMINAVKYTVLYPSVEGMAVGGSGRTIEFMLANGSSHIFYINNGDYIKNNECYILSRMPNISTDMVEYETNSFISYNDNYAVYENTEEKALVGEYSGMSKYEFTYCDEPADVIKAGYYIDAGFGFEIYVVDSNTFYLENAIYDSGEFYTVKNYYKLVDCSFDFVK